MITEGTDELVDLVTDSEEENVPHISPTSNKNENETKNEVNDKEKRKRKKKCYRECLNPISINEPLYRDYFISNKEFSDSIIKSSISNYKEAEVMDVYFILMINSLYQYQMLKRQ